MRNKKEKRIVIIGAGPTGLGAAHRLSELGYDNWDIYEKNTYPGGLSASFKDKKGFTWDMGGHVMFSRIPHFNKVVTNVLKKDYYEHLRKSFIYIEGKWVPYPFQNNIRYLAPRRMLECLSTLLEKENKKHKNPKNFEQWIYATFGSGIAKYFMIPQNRKVWRCPLREMSYDWIKERISPIDRDRILRNIIQKKDDILWGPNYKFKFPARGGTGEIFRRISASLSKSPHFNKEASRVEISGKSVIFKDKGKTTYDYLINTTSLDIFLGKILNAANAPALKAARQLKHSKVYVVGVGLGGVKKIDKCWAYFPNKNIFFYRITFFANYSPYNVPKKNAYSFMCEVSTKSLNRSKRDIINTVINDLIAVGVMHSGDRKRIISRYAATIDRAYPVPTLNRDQALHTIQSFLIPHNIYSRGRFGAWKYEIGNMDHSFMQGVEVVDNILFSKKEKIFS